MGFILTLIIGIAAFFFAKRYYRHKWEAKLNDRRGIAGTRDYEIERIKRLTDRRY